MSSTTSLDQNLKLRNSLIQDILSENISLPELSEKYNLEISEVFLWLKNLESRLHQTIEQPKGLFPPVDDQEWISLSYDEKREFIRHLQKADDFESETLSIDDLEQMRRNRKSKNA